MGKNRHLSAYTPYKKKLSVAPVESSLTPSEQSIIALAPLADSVVASVVASPSVKSPVKFEVFASTRPAVSHA